MKLRIWAIPLVLAVGIITGIACGDDDYDGDEDDETPATTRQATTAATTSTSGSGATVEATEPAGSGAIAVTAADFSFTPSEIEAGVGIAVTVELENTGDLPHTLTVYEDDTYATPVEGADTGNVAGGASGEFTATFDEAKTYAFRCDIHNQMQGTLTVE